MGAVDARWGRVAAIHGIGDGQGVVTLWRRGSGSADRAAGRQADPQHEAEIEMEGFQWQFLNLKQAACPSGG